MDFSQNPNPNPNATAHVSDTMDLFGFEFSDFLMLEDGWENYFGPQNMVSPENITGGPCHFADPPPRNSNVRSENGEEKKKVDARLRVAFRTKTELDIMDDGFKWRKYGKKKVKNSQNPRNYYKCSSEGCIVKKRIERDNEDSTYVITTYDGVHNHESPCVVYYNQTPLMIPDGWTLQASSSHSSSS